MLDVVEVRPHFVELLRLRLWCTSHDHNEPDPPAHSPSIPRPLPRDSTPHGDENGLPPARRAPQPEPPDEAREAELPSTDAYLLFYCVALSEGVSCEEWAADPTYSPAYVGLAELYVAYGFHEPAILVLYEPVSCALLLS